MGEHGEQRVDGVVSSFCQFAICRLCPAHVRKCTRPSLLYRTASNEKLGVGLGTRLGCRYAEVEITCRHRSILVHLAKITAHYCTCSVGMTDQHA